MTKKMMAAALNASVNESHKNHQKNNANWHSKQNNANSVIRLSKIFIT